jgi:hypothetical protein
MISWPGAMPGVRSTSCVGATAAEAPPASEKVNPAAPNTGTALFTRLRFEACFTLAIGASSAAVNVNDNQNVVIGVYAANFSTQGRLGRSITITTKFHVHERRRCRNSVT